MAPDKAGIKHSFAETLKRENKKVLEQFSNEYPISDITNRNSSEAGGTTNNLQLILTKYRSLKGNSAISSTGASPSMVKVYTTTGPMTSPLTT